MNMMSLLVQVLCGAAGGNIVGAVLKKFSLGPVGNSIAGIVGGGLGGQLLGMMSGGAASAAGGGGGSMVTNLLGGGLGGAVLMLLVGAVRGMTKKPAA